ncbi:MAG: ribonuclease HII [DPANN group archaeon]|nr:ribonuclease HII [DPANN group archaeon]
MVKILGIDEAGRGPVIGPMVLAAAMIEDGRHASLKDMGVNDSKKLTPEMRDRLFGLLKGHLLDYRFKILSVRQIDAAVDSPTTNLNRLEMAYMGALIDELRPDVVYIDAPTVSTDKFSAELMDRLDNKKVRLVCENRADAKYPIVGAASIIAKVKRDKEIEKLKKRFKVDFGSGYPSDPYTKIFLKENFDKYPFFRRSWAPWKNLNQKHNQKRLGDY